MRLLIVYIILLFMRISKPVKPHFWVFLVSEKQNKPATLDLCQLLRLSRKKKLLVKGRRKENDFLLRLMSNLKTSSNLNFDDASNLVCKANGDESLKTPQNST